MRQIVLERRHPGSSDWREVGKHPESGALASINSENQQVQELYQFGFVGGRPGLWVSRFGVSGGAARALISEKMDFVTDLSDEPYELWIFQAPVKIHMRLRVEEVSDGGSAEGGHGEPGGPGPAPVR